MLIYFKAIRNILCPKLMKVKTKFGLGPEPDPGLDLMPLLFSVHSGLAQALSTILGTTTWIGETAKWAQQHH
jgi:hypothetical protein